MYVDDLVSGSNTIEEVEVIKQKYIELFRNDRFNLHKWYLVSSATKSMPVHSVEILDSDRELKF